MKISYHRTALRDIQRTQDYIAGNLKNPPAAKRFAAAVLRAVSLLSANPQIGMPLNSKYEVDTDIRFLIVAKHLVFYRLASENEISILRVLDGRQDYIAILFG